ncbi:MAG: ester cyclase [Campylobacter sp.]|nr:ester cyclase [Campylobacter sp.]
MKNLLVFVVLLLAQILPANETLAENFNQICYQNTSKSECNKKAMHYFQIAINTADEVLADKLIDAKATFFTPVSKDPLYGGAGYISVVNFMRQSFPDIKWEIKDIVANDAVVAVLWECSGTHERGEFYGKKADKAKFSFSTMNFYYFDENGKITNDVAGEGLAGLLMDLEILK